MNCGTTGEVLNQATIKLKEHRNVRIDKIMKIEMLRQGLYFKNITSTFLTNVLWEWILWQQLKNEDKEFCVCLCCVVFSISGGYC